MERVAVSDLKVSRKLNKPLYSRTGRLLLAHDQILTRSMRASLEAAGLQYVFLGEWNATTLMRIETNCADYRTFGADLMKRLQRRIDEEIGDTPQQVATSSNPLSRRIVVRPTDRISKENQAANETAYLNSLEKTAEILSGGLPDEALPAAAAAATDQILAQFTSNPNLLLSLLRLCSGGPYLDQHSLNSAALSMSIGTAMGFDELQVRDLGVAALFKDIGMRGAPPELLTATRRLTPSEHIDIQKHTIAGLNAMQDVRGLPQVVRFAVYQHHERADGKGYPRGRRKTHTHPFSRIIAVADSFDSLTSPRPWRPALHPYRALESLLRLSETAYDNGALRGLLHYLSLFPVGSLMRLATGDIVRVIGTNPGHFHNPVVMVVRPQAGSGLETEQIIDMLENRDIKIVAPYEDPLLGIEERPGAALAPLLASGV